MTFVARYRRVAVGHLNLFANGCRAAADAIVAGERKPDEGALWTITGAPWCTVGHALDAAGLLRTARDRWFSDGYVSARRIVGAIEGHQTDDRHELIVRCVNRVLIFNDERRDFVRAAAWLRRTADAIDQPRRNTRRSHAL